MNAEKSVISLWRFGFLRLINQWFVEKAASQGRVGVQRNTSRSVEPGVL
jgi:hypothetical protein